MIEWIQYVLLGILQGITEPLPISSSGHLLLARTLFDIGEMDVFFEIMMHFASLFAVVLIFRQKIGLLIKESLAYLFKRSESSESLQYTGLVLLGSIPVGIVGLSIRNPLESILTSYGLIVIGASLIVTGSFLWLIKPYTLTNELETITWKDALVIGLAQTIAILPGISRSGATFVGGLFRKLSVQTVIEFSFMLYIPVTLGVSLLEILSTESLDIPLFTLISAFTASFIMTYVSLLWFRKVAIAGHLKGFAVYCFTVGTLSVLFYVV